jgi:hypothetical protein
MRQEGGERAEGASPCFAGNEEVRLSGEAATDLQGGAVGPEDAAVGREGRVCSGVSKWKEQVRVGRYLPPSAFSDT